MLVSLRQTRRILGAGLEQKLNDLALGQLAQVEKLLELVLPAGAAWLVTLVFALWGVALFASLLSTSGFKVCRSGGVILAKGGHVNHSERRIAVPAISACDVRLTPAGRLLGRRAVYLSAGSYRGGDIPVLVYKRGAEALVQALVPQFTPPPYSPEVLAGRSLPLFLWKGGAAFAFFGALMGVSLWKMPRLTPLLALPLLLCLGLLLAGAGGLGHRGSLADPRRHAGRSIHPGLHPAHGLSAHVGSFPHLPPDSLFGGRWAGATSSPPALPRTGEGAGGEIRPGGAAETCTLKKEGSQTMRYDTVVFDLDGTLLNTLQDLADAANYVCRAHGWPEHTLDEYRYFVGNGIPKLCQRFAPETARDEASQKEVLAQFSARYAAHKEDTTAPYPGIEAMLEALSAAGGAVRGAHQQGAHPGPGSDGALLPRPV